MCPAQPSRSVMHSGSLWLPECSGSVGQEEKGNSMLFVVVQFTSSSFPLASELPFMLGCSWGTVSFSLLEAGISFFAKQ